MGGQRFSLFYWNTSIRKLNFKFQPHFARFAALFIQKTIRMFWWGKSKPKCEVTHILPNIECPNCHDIGEMYITGYTKYFHIYWIPMWNIGKRIKYGCDSCEGKIKTKKVFGVSKEQIQAVKSEIRRPSIWHYTGLMVIGLVVLIFIYALISVHQTTKSRLNEPTINDIYLINAEKWGEDYYTSWQLIDIDGDSLMFAKNLYQAELWELSDSLEISTKHEGDTIMYPYEQMKKLFKKNILHRIDRNRIKNR